MKQTITDNCRRGLKLRWSIMGFSRDGATVCCLELYLSIVVFTGYSVKAQPPAKQRNSEGEKKNGTGGSCFLVVVGIFMWGLWFVVWAVFWSRKWEKEEGFVVVVRRCLEAVLWWLTYWVGNFWSWFCMVVLVVGLVTRNCCCELV